MRTRFFAIVAIALLPRLLLVFSGGDWAQPLRHAPQEEVIVAQYLASGRGYASPFPLDMTKLSPSAVSPPGFPFILAGIIRSTAAISGNQSLESKLPYRLTLLGGCLIAAIAIGLLALAGERIAGMLGFWVIGLLAAFWPTLVTQAPVLWDTPYSLLISAAAIYLATTPQSSTPRSWTWHLAVGAACGFAALINPAPAAILEIAAVILLLTDRARSVPRLAALVAMSVLCVSPWLIRNTMVFHHWIPIRNGMGLELWAGNQPTSDGSTKSLVHHPNGDPVERKLIEDMGEDQYMQLKSREAKELISADPARFARLSVHRVGLVWFGDANKPTKMFGRTMPMIAGLNLVKVLLNSLLIGAALARLLNPRPLPGRWILFLGPLLLPLPYYFTHVNPTYRASIDQYVCVLAGGFLVLLAGKFLYHQDGHEQALHGDR